MRACLWIPGTFSLTNQMLSNLRAAGYARGRAIRGAVDAFEQETKAIRRAAKAAVRRSSFGVLEGVPWDEVELEFWVFGHRKHDPDAWYLLGKAVTDGLGDAGVFASDRFCIGGTAGRVLTTLEGEACRRGYANETMESEVVPLDQPGVLVWMMAAGRCGHA